MVDITTYRSRIGLFRPHGIRRLAKRCYKPRYDHGMFNHKMDFMEEEYEFNRLHLNWKFVLALFLLSTCIYTAEDGRSAKNRQRKTKRKTYNTEEERTTFNELRTIDTKISKASSHKTFLQRCLHLDVYPKGLKPKENLCFVETNGAMNGELLKINEAAIISKMNVAIDHMEEIIFTLNKDREKIDEKMQSLCDKARYDFLASKLIQFKGKCQVKLEKTKESKLSAITRNDSRPKSADMDNSWIPSLELTKDDKQIILSGEWLDDHIITTSMNLLKIQYPLITVQPPAVGISPAGFNICLSETIQIVYNGRNHWALISSLRGKIRIYDSLNKAPTPSLMQQIRNLFSPDNSTPAFEQIQCHKQYGGSDCGLFAIAYAMEILHGSEPQNIVFDQSKMRSHLVSCLENNVISTFPKYEKTNLPTSYVNKVKTDWVEPRRSKRIMEKQSKNHTVAVEISNRFTPTPTRATKNNKTEKRTVKDQTTNPKTTSSTSKNTSSDSIVFNISGKKLTNSETSALEKGPNFAPTTKMPNKENVLNDVYAFCRKAKLRDFFHSDEDEEEKPDESKKPSWEDENERCKLDTKISNKYYHPEKEHPVNLNVYLAAVKDDVCKMMETPKYVRSNISNDERIALRNLSKRDDIQIQTADKGGKVVIMDKTQYKDECENQLNDASYYEKADDNTTSVCEDIEIIVDGMLKKEDITDQDHKFLTQNLRKSRVPIFYGLPKIHKIFNHFPPLRPIVSHIGSATYNLSKFIDSFLKYQARRCNSFIRDSKDFLKKIKNIGRLPEKSILVTMDVSALYTNIDHDEGADACYEKLETRKKKRVSSSCLKQLIKVVLENNVFRFGAKIYRQIKGTAMGTPMAPNYANIFMDKFETGLIADFEKQHGLKPLVWFRYIDDIFFIWTDGHESLRKFIDFAQTYSQKKKMKSTIKFEVNFSEKSVHFLDITVSLMNGLLETTLYTKPTDGHMYLNRSSCHPRHVIKNIPKGQFIRIRRICSQKSEYFRHGRVLISHFVKHGYSESKLKEVLKLVSDIPRESLLVESQSQNEESNAIVFVSDWHPTLQNLSSVLRKHYHLLKGDARLSKVFPSPPKVAFRRMKTIRNHVIRNDLVRDCSPVSSGTTPCGHCKLCANIIQRNDITVANGTKLRVASGGTCKSKNVIYAAWCKKHNLYYIGQTGEQLNDRFSKHRYDIYKRPKNSELANHFHEGHDLEDDLKVFILEQLQENNSQLRERCEDRWICRLQSLQPNGINSDIGVFGKELYSCYQRCF